MKITIAIVTDTYPQGSTISFKRGFTFVGRFYKQRPKEANKLELGIHFNLKNAFLNKSSIDVLSQQYWIWDKLGS